MNIIIIIAFANNMERVNNIALIISGFIQVPYIHTAATVYIFTLFFLLLHHHNRDGMVCTHTDI